jgi:hypothetical protein
MQQELDCMLKESSAIGNHGAQALRLIAASGYVSRLVGNQAIESYLRQHRPEMLHMFRTVPAVELRN